MKKIVDYLRDKYGPWGWMGQRAHDAVGINKVLPLEFIISCDYGSEMPYYFREDDVFSVEKQCGVRKDWSNEDLNASFRGTLGREIFKRWDSYKKKVNLVCYRSIKRLEIDRFKQPRKPRIYAAPERLKKRFDNKVLLYKNLSKLGLPKIPGKTDRLSKCTFNNLRKELSLPFVIQFPYGSSGHFTFIIREEKEYIRLRKKYPDSIVVIRKYIDGFSLNVNAIIVSFEEGPRTFCTFPSVQIAGVPECSNFASAFCGNDYASAVDLDRGIIKQVEDAVTSVSAWMGAGGFRGIFGMDFMVKNGVVYPVEINPRFQNSTSLYTVLNERSQSFKEMLFLLNIAEFLQEEDKVMREYVRKFPKEELMSPVKGCQVILHNRMKTNIVMGRLEPGVYRLEDHNLNFMRRSASLASCRNQDDIMVTCGIPAPDTIVEPNAPICKVQMLKSGLDPANRSRLSKETKEIVMNVYKKLRLRERNKIKIAEVV